MVLLCSCWLTGCPSRRSLRCAVRFESRQEHSTTLTWEVWEPICRPFASSSDWQLSLPLDSRDSRTSLLNSSFSLAHSKTQRQAWDLTNFKLSGRSPFGVLLSLPSICCA